MSSFDALRRVRSRVEEELLAYPNVTGIDIGRKYVRRRETDERAIRVYVSRKRDMSPAETIPSEIHGATTDYGDFGQALLRNLINIRTDMSRSAHFSNEGDSGSAIVKQNGGIVGLLMGGATDGSTSLAVPIETVIASLNIKLDTLPFGRHWRQLPGAGQDISVGADGSVWVIGIPPCDDNGCGVYRFDGKGFIQVDGAGTRIAVDPGADPWVVNKNAGIFRFVTGKFHQLRGAATDIGIGADGSIWIIEIAPCDENGCGIYHFDGQNFIQVEGSAKSIAVDRGGNSWVVNKNGGIFRFVNGKFQRLPGAAVDIGVGAEGSVCVIWNVFDPSGFQIFRWNGTGWNLIFGAGVAISVGPDGLPWVTNLQVGIFQRI